MSPAQPIGIAVVEHAARFLVGIRAAGGPLPGRAEFPGGKCRPGETPRACAERECLEETGLRVVAATLLLERPFEYPHGLLELSFWGCRVADEESIRDEHRGFRWVPREQLSGLDFPPANAPLIARLIRSGG